MFKRKIKERQVIQQEPADANPMDQLAQETENKFPEQQIPEPPLPRKTIQDVEEARENIAKGESYTEEEAKEKLFPDTSRWVVGEVPTSTEKVLHDKTTGKSYDIYSAIALILNKAYEDN